MAGSSRVGNPSLLIADQGSAVEAAQPPGTRRRCRDRRRGLRQPPGDPRAAATDSRAVRLHFLGRPSAPAGSRRCTRARDRWLEVPNGLP